MSAITRYLAMLRLFGMLLCAAAKKQKNKID